MASRKEEREQRRAERREAERKREDTAKRQRIVGYGVAGLLTAAVVAGIIVLVAGGGSDSSGDSAKAPNGNSVPAAAEVGAQTTPPPWQPEYDHLGERLDALGLPGLNEQIFHIHSLLHVYIHGEPVTVPANIGFKEPTGPFSPIHTHDDTGIIHMEADQEYDFTIGQFFAVWGVAFSNDQLGPYKPKGDDKLSVYVDGKKVSDPVNYVMKEHDNIAVGYGKPGSFPTKPQGSFPAGL
jgi:hypothetical protein